MDEIIRVKKTKIVDGKLVIYGTGKFNCDVTVLNITQASMLLIDIRDFLKNTGDEEQNKTNLR